MARENKGNVMANMVQGMVEGLSEPIKEDKKGGRGADLKPRKTRTPKVITKEEEEVKTLSIPISIMKEIENIIKEEDLRTFRRGAVYLLKKGIESYKKDNS